MRDEQRATEDDRQGHPDIGDAEHRAALAGIGEPQRDREGTDHPGDQDDHPGDRSGKELAPGRIELFGEIVDRHEAAAAIGDRATEECRDDQEQARGFLHTGQQCRVEGIAQHGVDEHDRHLGNQRKIDQHNGRAIDLVQPVRRGEFGRAGESKILRRVRLRREGNRARDAEMRALIHHKSRAVMSLPQRR